MVDHGRGNSANTKSIAKSSTGAKAGLRADPGDRVRRGPDGPSGGANATARYLALWKPYDVLSQFTAEVPGQRTLAEFGLPDGVYPAGRLDRDSEGLLLLTDDGPFIKRLLTPGRGHARTYWVQVEGDPGDAVLAGLAAGVVIKGSRTLPCTVHRLVREPVVPPRDPPIRVRRSIPTAWLSMKLREGKNRQVRRMTAAMGHPTLRLIRVAIGDLTLDGLAPGQWRPISIGHIGGTARP